MASPLERSIREQILDRVAGRLSLAELDDWLWPAKQEIEAADDPVARDLTYEIILRIAEYDNGQRSEADVETLLQPFAEPAVPVGSRGEMQALRRRQTVP